MAETDPGAFSEFALARGADPSTATGLLLALLQELERLPTGDRLDLLTQLALAQKTEARRQELTGEADLAEALQRQTLAHGAARELARRLTPAELAIRLRTAPPAHRALLIGLAVGAQLPLLDPAALAAQLSLDAGELAAAMPKDPVHAELTRRELEDRLEVLGALPPQAKTPALLDLLAQGTLPPLLADEAVSALPHRRLADGASARLARAAPSGRLALSRLLLDPSRGDPGQAPAAIEALQTVVVDAALALETRSAALDLLEDTARTSSVAERALTQLSRRNDRWLHARLAERP